MAATADDAMLLLQKWLVNILAVVWLINKQRIGLSKILTICSLQLWNTMTTATYIVSRIVHMMYISLVYQ
jgi:hypothetical protein